MQSKQIFMSSASGYETHEKGRSLRGGGVAYIYIFYYIYNKVSAHNNVGP